VRSELRRLSEVNIIVYQSFAPAVLSVYSTDPATFEWHLYTEGWSRGGAQRYDAGSVNSFIAPWLGNMPGWREQGFWQYENPTADELGQKLYKGQFASQEERNDLYRQLTQIGLDESASGCHRQTTFAAPKLTNLTRRLSGPRTRTRCGHDARRTAINGRPVGLDRRTWNPVAVRDASNDIWRNMTDPPSATTRSRAHGPFRRLHGGDRGSVGHSTPADAVTGTPW
jgi:peptide/nickel transport system substrate-binding protein